MRHAQEVRRLLIQILIARCSNDVAFGFSIAAATKPREVFGERRGCVASSLRERDYSVLCETARGVPTRRSTRSRMTGSKRVLQRKS
jgi:hypothetical protein